MLGHPPALIHWTAPLDAGFCGNCRKNTDHVLGGSSPAPWLIGPPDATSRLDSTRLGSDTGRVPGVALRPGHNTGDGQQDARSGAVGTSESPATHVTKFLLGHRLPPQLEAPGAGILPPTSAQGAGAASGALACRTTSKAPRSPLLPALRDVHATIGRTGAARLPAPSANLRNFWSRGQVVIQRARAAWQNR